MFNLDNSSSSGLNVSLSVSYDYEKDVSFKALVLILNRFKINIFNPNKI